MSDADVRQPTSSSNTFFIVPILLLFGLFAVSVFRSPSPISSSGTGSAIIVAAPLFLATYALTVVVMAGRGGVASLTGVLLLGWSGGGFIGVGDPYLFMTLAAVVVGGTSLLGGWGGYGFTVIGVLVLQVLSSFLVGIGFNFEVQRFVFGLLILPMVAMYARSPHIRTQI